MTVPSWMLEAVQTPQIGFLGSLIGAVVPALVGGLFGGGSQQGNGQRRDSGWDRVDRERYIEDRTDERRYAEAQKGADRAYTTWATENSRNYDRGEWNRQHDLQRREMLADTNYYQQESDKRAELNAQSRGFDLGKLREQAEASGFNPLTLMSMGLGGYSTEIGYNAVAPGVTGSSGGGGVSHVAAGGSYAGAGYQRSAGPLMSPGSFLGDAMERGLDTFFNTPPANDPLADALRDAMSASNTITHAEERSTPPQGFGYDLTKVEPYSARKTAGIPPLSERPVQNPANAARTKRKVRDVAGNVVSIDDSIAERLDIPEYGQMMAGDLAEVFGEIPGEAEAALRAEKIRGSAMPSSGIVDHVPPLWKDGPAGAGKAARDAIKRRIEKMRWF